MAKFRLEDWGGCFREQRDRNGVFGKLISRHPCEVPVIDGAYADEECYEPVARLDGRTENLWAAADPDLGEIYRQQRLERKVKREEQDRQNDFFAATLKHEADKEEEVSISKASLEHEAVEEGEDLEKDFFFSYGFPSAEEMLAEEIQEFMEEEGFEDLEFVSRFSMRPEEEEEFLVLSELREHDPQESFPQPIKPMQSYFFRKLNGGQFRNSSKRNCGRKPLKLKNCRETIRSLEEDNDETDTDLLDEILKDSLQVSKNK